MCALNTVYLTNKTHKVTGVIIAKRFIGPECILAAGNMCSSTLNLFSSEFLQHATCAALSWLPSFTTANQATMPFPFLVR